MIGIQRLREIFPQYADKSDEEMARAYYRKLYAKMPYEEFQRRFHAASVDYAKKGKGGRREAAAAGKAEEKRQKDESARSRAELVKVMDASGFGLDKESGNFYRYRYDEKGKRGLDYQRGALRDEQIQEVVNRSKGLGPLDKRQEVVDPAERNWFEFEDDSPEFRRNYLETQRKDALRTYEANGGDYRLPDNYSPIEANRARYMSGMPGMNWERDMAGARNGARQNAEADVREQIEALKQHDAQIYEPPSRPVRIEGMDISGDVEALGNIASKIIPWSYGDKIILMEPAVKMAKDTIARGLEWLGRQASSEGPYDPYEEDYTLYNR